MKEYLMCLECGNIITDSDDNICCGKSMCKVIANSKDASQEKHVPIVLVNDSVVTVKVGEIEHPMEEEHYIKWIYLITNKGIKKNALKPNMEPISKFRIDDTEKVINALEYCNLHGLWSTE